MFAWLSSRAPGGRALGGRRRMAGSSRSGAQADPAGCSLRIPGRCVVSQRARMEPAHPFISQPQGGAMSQSPTDVISNVYGAFAQGDIPGIVATVAEDVTWRVPENLPHGGDFHGRDGVV